MELKEISIKELNQLAVRQKHAPFLQSRDWADFQSRSGRRVSACGLFGQGRIVAAALLIENSLPLGQKYWYSPRGPVTNGGSRMPDYEFVIEDFLKQIKKPAKKKKVIFFRFEPESDFRHSESGICPTIPIQPQKTLIVDLAKSEDELLAGMHQKTRYNIRLAAKKGVAVDRAEPDEFDDWWEVMQETKDRDEFRLHAAEHYRRLLEVNSIRLYAARYQGRIIAGNLVSEFGDTAVYVHGGSSNQHRNVMAPFALQWQSILQAKAKGLKYYDLNGIDEVKWAGVTRFKKGFGGKDREYPGTFDLAIDKTRYQAYKSLRWLRRKFKAF